MLFTLKGQTCLRLYNRNPKRINLFQAHTQNLCDPKNEIQLKILLLKNDGLFISD